MFKHMKLIKRDIMEMMNKLDYSPLSPEAIAAGKDSFMKLRDSITPLSPEAKEAFEKLKSSLPSPESVKKQKEAFQNLFKPYIEPEEDNRTNQKHPGYKINGKLRIKKISGIELVTLTMIVRMKSGDTYIENFSVFVDKLMRLIDLDRKFTPESFRRLYYSQKNKYSKLDELEHYDFKRFTKLEKFLQTDLGKEFEKIVIELMG